MIRFLEWLLCDLLPAAWVIKVKTTYYQNNYHATINARWWPKSWFYVTYGEFLHESDRQTFKELGIQSLRSYIQRRGWEVIRGGGL